MQEIRITNSLSGKKEKFKPIDPENVGMYTCGPTVYDHAQIGNLRTYTAADIVIRTLKFNGYKVKYIMNITDVGHLVSDADEGEDKMQKAVRRENKNAWELARFYTESFISDMKNLNLIPPDNLTKATEHIDEQIDLVKRLEEKEVTYQTSDGIYFDTKKYEEVTGNKYGELSTMDQIKEGARVEANPEKRNPTDFALWKFSEKPGERQMEWESPWGVGFPGWHIECSAMSMKYLGESFDIHVGGEDLRQTHHPNEIAQSQAATGKQFVKYWIHGTFLKVNDERMGKSKGNAYTLNHVIEKGFDPLALRYLYLTAHYRDTLNFTWEALNSAQNALNNIRKQMNFLRKQNTRTVLSEEKRQKTAEFSQEFTQAINDDFNTAQALAVLWKALKSNIPSEDKYDLAITFDEIFGLKLASPPMTEQKEINIPKSEKKAVVPVNVTDDLINLLEEREIARDNKDFVRSDDLRVEIESLGFTVEDQESGPVLTKK